MLINCNTATLDPYVPSVDNPWDISKVNHIYRRLGYGISVSEALTALSNSPSQLIDNIFATSQVAAFSPAPIWADWNRQNYPEDAEERGALKFAQFLEWRSTYTNDLLSNLLRDRMSFFWSNHFVTEIREHTCPSYLYYYTNALQTYALGNFKTFVYEIGITNAMLRYLDGYENYKNRPNENYARELFELFTLGEGNGYTEEDILEAARALTGYTQRNIEGVSCSGYSFDPNEHDTGSKTIFGQTGNWNYGDLIDILFQERSQEIAHFICSKLYQFFVHPEPVEEIIAGMVNTFITNNFELIPVLDQLFKSEHFFDENAVGVIIKSPFDLILTFSNDTLLPMNETEVMESLLYYCKLCGQDMFNPVDVAGWQRDKQWINTNLLMGRWFMLEYFLYYHLEHSPETFRNFGIALAGADNTDPADVTKKIVDKLVPKGLMAEEDYTIATDVFRGDVPQNYYDDNIWNLNWSAAPTQVHALLMHISKQPEFQLK